MTDDQRSIDIQLEVPGTPSRSGGHRDRAGDHLVVRPARGRAPSGRSDDRELRPRAGDAGQRAGRRLGAPTRVVFDGGRAPRSGLRVACRGRDGGMSIVRLVNTGFGDGEEWDAV